MEKERDSAHPLQAGDLHAKTFIWKNTDLT